MLSARFCTATGTGWLCLAVFFCWAGTRQAAADPAEIVQQEQQRILAALDQRADWKFVEIPLNDFASQLAARFDVNVLIDTVALEDFGIARETPLTANVAGISGRSMLNVALRELDLAWMVRDGLLVISTPEELESQLITKTYPVGDLIGSAGGANAEYNYGPLKAAITSSIGPDSWGQVGGPGSIEGIHASLVVSQVWEVHEQIEFLLAGARRLAQRLSADPNDVPEPIVLEGPGGERIRAELDKRTAVEFTDIPLEDAVRFIADLHGIPIVIDRVALEDFGIGTDVPVSFSMRRLPLRNTLRTLLRELDLTFIVRDEVLLVTTPEEAESMLQTAIYPVSDLVGSPAAAGDGERYFDEAGSAEGLDFDSLVDTITSSVAPDSWDVVGGPGAVEILLKPTGLLISQTEEVHEQIVDLMAQVRRAKATQRQRMQQRAQQEEQDPQYFIKAYPLLLANGEQRVIAQLVELLTSSIGRDVWQEHDRVLLKAVGTTIVVRHRRGVHRSVQRLLHELQYLPVAGSKGSTPGPQGAKGGGFFQVQGP